MFTLLFVLFLAQAQVAPAVSAPVPLPTISDVDKDKLNVLAYKKALLEANARLAEQAYAKQMEQMRSEYAKVSAQLNDKIESVFKGLDLDKAKYDIDLETGKVFELKK